MDNVPNTAPPEPLTAAVQDTITELDAEYDQWWFEYAAGEPQPWRAHRSESDAKDRAGAYTAIRARTPEILRDFIRASDWLDSRDAGR